MDGEKLFLPEWSQGGLLPEYTINDVEDDIQHLKRSLGIIDNEQDVKLPSSRFDRKSNSAVAVQSTASTKPCAAPFGECSSLDDRAQSQASATSHSILTTQQHDTLSSCLTSKGIPTVSHSDGREIFVNNETALSKPPLKLDKAYSPTTYETNKRFDDLMEIIENDSKGNDVGNSKVWNTPTLAVEQHPKHQERQSVQINPETTLSKVFQEESQGMKNSDSQTSHPTNSSDFHQTKEGSRKRTNDEDKAFTENNLYGKIAKNQTLIPHDEKVFPSLATHQSLTLGTDQVQIGSDQHCIGPANTIIHQEVERSPAHNTSPRLAGPVDVGRMASRGVAVMSLASHNQADGETYGGSSCTADPGSSYGWQESAAMVSDQIHGMSCLDFATNSNLQQSSHFCSTALSHASITQSRHPSGQLRQVPIGQQQFVCSSESTRFATKVKLAEVPQHPGQFYPVTQPSYAGLSEPTHSGSGSTFHAGSTNFVAPSVPIDPARFGVASSMQVQSIRNQTPIRPASTAKVETEERLKSFNRNPSLLLSCHRMIGALAQSGFSLSQLHDSVIQCVDKSCETMHLLPKVLEQESSKVTWHKTHCRFFSERKPCKYCVGLSSQKMECMKCGYTSQTGRTFGF